ncbi:aspartic peptidase domain-containing protein [Truncatella angustata]|uniref:Aspartic peptidase domain-containing protein n=1 Tax=Truncatella angustata TaxID=152316 RepID=A0A9P8UBD7_9PEZI|nr:aspartic peptidase domain-containing protein [Truncatella angustata]KAH6643379.1 aspartic peptidase domain-containing protein [Truncatella angustata]
MRPATVNSAIILHWISECWAFGDSNVVGARATSNNTSLQPVVIGASQYFEGNDGPWSTFDVRVGEPAQDIRVLVSTASPQSMVVVSESGCSTAVFATVPAGCAVSRGNLFNWNDSSSWIDVGLYGINQDGVGLEANLGYSQRAEFGLETLAIGLTGPSLENQTVAGIATAEPFYLGVFGLNSQPVNFTTLGNYSAPSFLTTLKDEGRIPSLSWSYTAGAQYRLKEVYGQLIFSGYDTSRFTENSVTFTMADDLTRDLVVVVQSISYSGSTSATLLSDPINIFIDSTDPNFWLPDQVCDAFEHAFGLTLDDTTGLYLVNETHHTTLVNSNAEVTFRLSDVTSGGDSVRIVLPYDAFDLTAEYPLVENTSYYFPLKRAANSTQYTLGRAFLQETHLSADYERGVFNVSACVWNEGAEENIVAITSKDSDESSGAGGDPSAHSSGSSSLSGGAIAGIVVGVVVGILIVAAIIAFILRRRRRKVSYAASEPEPDESVLEGPEHNTGPKPEIKLPNGPELDGNTPQIYQLHGDSSRHIAPKEPAPQQPIYELAASEAGRSGTDRVSTLTTTPSPDEKAKAGEASPPSPYVSTLGTTGWPEGERWEASSDIVSPTTPIHGGSYAAHRGS